MKRISIHAFTPSPEAAATIRISAEKVGCPVTVDICGIEQATAEARTWTVIPDILILDVSAEADQEAAIQAFATAAPEGETSLVIIGRGDDVKTYRAFKQLGAIEYIPSPIDAEETTLALAGVRRLASGRVRAVDPGKLILVVSARGGAGGSTVAAEISRGVAGRHGKRTLLIDLDTESGCQHSLFGIDATQGFAMLLESPDSVDSLLLNRTIEKTAQANLTILSDLIPESANRFAPTAPTQLAAAIAKDVDTIVFDVPARSLYFKELATVCETMVVVAPPTYHGLRDTMNLLDIAEKTGGAKRTIVYINRIGEVRAGSVGPEVFKQKLAKGARPEFRDQIRIAALPYAPKQALRAANTSESLLDDQNSPLAKALSASFALLPTAPAPAKRSGFFSKLIGG